MSAQEEYLNRLDTAVTRIEQDTALFKQFMHGPVGQTISVEGGELTTVLGLQEEIRDMHLDGNAFVEEITAEMDNLMTIDSVNSNPDNQPVE